ncbi:TPA: hypothetical protein ACKRXH_003824 [Proteus mirabilis]|nr:MULTISPECIES: hypothetical protein [Morganellaceae]
MQKIVLLKCFLIVLILTKNKQWNFGGFNNRNLPVLAGREYE